MEHVTTHIVTFYNISPCFIRFGDHKACLQANATAVRHPTDTLGTSTTPVRLTPMGQVILLSLTASFNPTLVAATTVMLLLPGPSS
jgi:hypothetical protein